MYGSAFITALITVVKWLLVAAICFGFAHRLIVAWFDRELAAWEAALLLCALLGFGSLALKLSDSLWFYPLLAGTLIVMMILRTIPARIAERRKQEMLQADIEAYQKALDFDPRNVAAYSFLGDTYMRTGDVDRAIEYYRKALEVDPKLLEEKKKLEKAERRKWIESGVAMFCRRCFRPRQPGHRICPECGRFFPFYETIAFNLRHVPRETLFFWLGAAGAAMVLTLALAASNHTGLAVLIGLVSTSAAGLLLHQLAQWKGK
jgi:tetratricopeptide (TPR) repeat protein